MYDLIYVCLVKVSLLDFMIDPPHPTQLRHLQGGPPRRWDPG